MFSTQQLYNVMLNYAPKVACFDDHCVKIKGKCYEPCPECPDECPRNVTQEVREQCKEDKVAYFYTPMMEYKINCPGHIGHEYISCTETQYFGALLGNIFVGYLADKYGRRRMLIISLLGGIPFLIFSALINNVISFYIFRFLVGVSIAGTMAVGWAFCAEMISPKHRFKLRTFTSWTNGRLLMIAVAHAAGTWRLASYWLAVAAILPLIAVIVLPESPVWLKRKGNFEKEETARKKIDWLNGFEPQEESEKESAPLQPQPPRQSFITALKDKQLRLNVFVLCVMWFCAGLSTYSIDLNGEDMTKNMWIGQYFNSGLASLLRIFIGFADAKFKWLGRRKVYTASMGICILASLALLIEIRSGMKEQENRIVYFITYLLAYNSIAISWEPNYMGAAELIPTEVRATNTALLNIVTRIANILAARTVAKWKGKEDEWAIMVVVLTSCIISFVVTVSLLKETKGVSLDMIGQERKSKSPSTSPRDEEEGRGSKSDAEKGSKSEVEGDESKPQEEDAENKEETDDKKEGSGSKEDENKKLLGDSAEGANESGGSKEPEKDDKQSGSADPANEQ